MDEALRLAEMWLDPVTDLAATAIIGRAWSRAEWVEETLGTWQRLTEPVANSIAFAISKAMNEQLPEEMKSAMGGAASMMQNMGGALFGLQLGQAVGALAKEVLGSTDIGIPLADLQMALIPSNIKAFGEGLEVPEQEILLYLALREAAHARLFVQVPWLRGHLLGAIESYARGIHIDMSRIEDLAHNLDPSNPGSHAGTPCPRVSSCRPARPSRTPPWPSWKQPWPWLRAGLTSSALRLQRICRRPRPSAKPSAAAVPRAARPSTPSARWLAWSCARAGSARPQPCGPR